MKTAYLSLGSNLGDRRGNLRRGLERLAGPDLRVVRVSPVYETEPVDNAAQGRVLNLAAEIETSLFPMQLLARAMRVEQAMGRRRGAAKGPRTLDIDILLYGKAVMKSAALEIPHPRMDARRFVLQPLADLAPDLRHPATRRTVREMLGAIEGQGLRPAGPL